MFTEVVELTGIVVTANVAVVAPAGTVMLPGAVAIALSLNRATWAPSVGAGPVKVTVPVAEAPPVTLAGLKDTEARLLVGAGAKKTSA